MTPEQDAALRKPFLPEQIGKLPRTTCQACSRSDSKVCKDHKKAECRVCGNYMTTRHIHLDYVGHAFVCDRLLSVDPEWTWEPSATNEHGAPWLDQNGGLWIRLTVAGVTRLGYGHADGKISGDAVKVSVGDALRNAAMRFGVALDLWAKGDLPHEETSDAPDPVASAINAAKRRLLEACEGDKTRAADLWGDRSDITDDELTALLEAAVLGPEPGAS